MNAKSFFRLIAAIIIATVCVSLAVCLWKEGLGGYRLVVAEACVCITAVLLAILYHKTVRPLDILNGGVNLLKEQDFSSRLLPVGQKDADNMVSLFNGMMSRLRNEKLAIRERNHFLDLLIEASPMGILIMDMDGRISSANPSMCRFTGLPSIEPLVGKKPEECTHALLKGISGIGDRKSSVIQTDPAHIYKCTRASFMDNGFPHPFYMVEPLTEELFEAEKRGYKKVIRIISHEVNNTMAGISSAIEAIGEEVENHPENEDISRMVPILLSRIGRMKEFIGSYAEMARIPDPVLIATDGDGFLKSVFPFLESLKGRKEIRFSLETGNMPYTVNIDPVLMEQVLTNIVKNAIEAFGPDSPENEITIRSDKGYWCIENNGRPISKESASRLFTPFYTDKPDGKGIGLTVVQEILSRSGVGYKLGTGEDGLTRFEIFFRQHSSLPGPTTRI